MSQPAAELIANALAKIKKLAGSKKHADLAQQCQKLIDSIHEVSMGGQQLQSAYQQLQRYGWHTLSAARASSSHSLHTCGVVSVLMNHHGNPQTPVMYHIATLKVTCAAQHTGAVSGVCQQSSSPGSSSSCRHSSGAATA